MLRLCGNLGGPIVPLRSMSRRFTTSVLILYRSWNVRSCGTAYRILTAQTPREAFRLLASNNVDVIVSDQRMPEMTGTEFFHRVKDMYPETVRIILSGYTDLASVTSAINKGAIYRYFTKPWDDKNCGTP